MTIDLRVVPYLIFDRSENEAVKNRNTVSSKDVMLFNNMQIVQLMKHHEHETFTEICINVARFLLNSYINIYPSKPHFQTGKIHCGLP